MSRLTVYERAEVAISDIARWVEQNAATLDTLEAGIAREMEIAFQLAEKAIDAGEAAAEELEKHRDMADLLDRVPAEDAE